MDAIVKRVTVIGTGYLGATHAACMAELGYEVLGMDVDAGKIAALSEGRITFHEPGLPELLAKHVASGRLRFTTSFEEVARFGVGEAEPVVHFVCVNTPQRKGGVRGRREDYLEAVVDEVWPPHLSGSVLVVNKSTSPAGTARCGWRSGSRRWWTTVCGWRSRRTRSSCGRGRRSRTR